VVLPSAAVSCAYGIVEEQNNTVMEWPVRREFIPGNNNVYEIDGSFSGTYSWIADITGPNEKFCEGFNKKNTDGQKY
jgi:hypothetical protein